MRENLAMWLTIIIYVGVIVVIGIVSGRKTKSIADLTVGGRSAGAWLSALSYGTAYFSAVMFVGYAGGTGKSFGLWGIAAGIGNAVFGSWLAWKVLARRTRDVSARLHIKTMPQFFDSRFDSKAMKTFAAVVIFIFLVPYSASVYKGLTSVANVLLGIDETICMIIIAVMAALIMLFGGYMVQARADFFQGIVMMGGVALLLFFVIKSDPVGGLAGIGEYAKTELGLPSLNASQVVSLTATVLMTSFGTWGLPQMIQKYFGIKDDAHAKRGATISTVFALLIAGGGYFIGSLCYMFFTSETLPEQDYIVPRMLEMANLPNILMGVVIVLLLSASVSTLCSITLTASTTLSMDLIHARIRPSMKKEKLPLLIKVLCVVFVAVSYIVANTKTPILDMMSYSWGIISGSFLAPYVLSLYMKKLTKTGAWAGMLSGFSVAIIPAGCKILQIAGVSNSTVLMLAGKGPLFACIAMLLSLLVCWVAALASKTVEIPEKTAFFYDGVVSGEE